MNIQPLECCVSYLLHTPGMKRSWSRAVYSINKSSCLNTGYVTWTPDLKSSSYWLIHVVGTGRTDSLSLCVSWWNYCFCCFVLLSV